jgi:hypothetical protein
LRTVPVGFAVVDDLELAHAAVQIDAQRIGDELVLADDLVEDKPAHRLASGPGLPDLLLGTVARAGLALDAFDDLIGSRVTGANTDSCALGEDDPWACSGAHVLGGDTLRGGGAEDGGRRQPADVEAHA